MFNKKIIEVNESTNQKDNIYLIDLGVSPEDGTSVNPQIWDLFYYEKHFNSNDHNLIESYIVNNYSQTMNNISKKTGLPRNIQIQDGYHSILLDRSEKIKRHEFIKQIDEILNPKSADEEIKDVKNRLTKIEDQLSTLINLLNKTK